MRPTILFTSSISTIANWNDKFLGAKVPEAPFHDYTIPAPTGYAMSKYVGERVLENAAKISGIPVSIVRVGQVGGPVIKKGGMWNKQEWLPSVSPELLPITTHFPCVNPGVNINNAK